LPHPVELKNAAIREQQELDCFVASASRNDEVKVWRAAERNAGRHTLNARAAWTILGWQAANAARAGHQARTWRSGILPVSHQPDRGAIASWRGDRAGCSGHRQLGRNGSARAASNN
jgi:hypothetical protein